MSDSHEASERGDSIRRIVSIAAGLTLVGLAVHRLLLVRDLAGRGWFLKYIVLAEELVGGSVPAERLTDVSPLYLWFIALVHFIIGVPAELVLLLQAGMVCLAAALCGLIARSHGGAVAAFLAAGFLLLNRAAFVNAAEFEPETLILLLNTLALVALVRSDPERNRGLLLAGGLALGLSSVARPNTLATVLLLALWLGVRWWRADPAARSRVPGAGLLFLSGAVAPLLAAVALNLMLAGSPVLMNPGTVFYEGMNPQATGYGSAEPLVVVDLRSVITEVDAVHVAYRMVASRAEGAPLAPRLSNAFWTGKAFAFIEEQPAEAMRLTLRKLGFLLHSYDAWDLSTMMRKQWAAGIVWIPFGVLVAFAAIPFFRLRDHPAVVPLAIYLAGQSIAPLLFYVTSRQRNPLLPALVILAALGVVSLYRMLAASQRRQGLIAAAAVMTLSLALTIDGRWQTEREHLWIAGFAHEELKRQAAAARASGDATSAAELSGLAESWLASQDLHHSAVPAEDLRIVAQRVVETNEPDARIFDVAHALARAGAWADADRLFDALQQRGYRPARQALTSSSLDYYRALAALAAGLQEDTRTFLRHATAADPANPDVLALRVLLENDPVAARKLERMHDPFVAALARAGALIHSGRNEEGARELDALGARLPKWSRPALIRSATARVE
jgi:4-amino-4-deoxy-L-arabinose transferase-like glycosyltransferase